MTTIKIKLCLVIKISHGNKLIDCHINSREKDINVYKIPVARKLTFSKNKQSMYF